MTTLKAAFLAKYPKNGIIAEKWQTATGTPFAWASLTKPNMSTFTQWLCDDMAQTSARQYCAKLMGVIEPFTDEHQMPREWRKFLTIKDDESQHTYLTEDEIRLIIAYTPASVTEATVQQQFVLGCLTGARHSDYSRFTEANITPTGHLVYVSQKTHIKAELPLSPVARGILFATGTPFAMAYKRKVADSTFNETVRRICKACGISYTIQLYRNGDFWRGAKHEAISSHTSRRSFCTNLYLRCRDLLLVSKLAGHTNTAMTERYICCGMESLTESAMNYFAAF